MELIEFDYNGKHYLLSPKGDVMEKVIGGFIPRDDVSQSVIDNVFYKKEKQKINAAIIQRDIDELDKNKQP